MYWIASLYRGWSILKWNNLFPLQENDWIKEGGKNGLKEEKKRKEERAKASVFK